MSAHRSSAVPLAVAYAALIAYASLYPFSGWELPSELPLRFLVAGWPRWWTAFDLVSNLVGYLPLGALVFVAQIRIGRSVGRALGVAVAVAALLSLTLETLQNLLPQRVPSNVDLALNALGGALGGALGVLVHGRGGIARWQTLRERWLIERSAGGVVLLLLWPIGLLFPAPVPLGLGQVADRLQETLAEWLDGSSLASLIEPWLVAVPATVPLSPVAETACVALGLLVPCLIGYAIAPSPWRRLVLAAGALVLAVATTTLSTALNFGPDHAFAWRTPNVLVGLGVGTLFAALFAPLPRRAAAGVGLIAVTALVLLVDHAPADPYFASSLQAWELGRFIRFHGAARWVGWLWPYAAMGWLLARIGARDGR